MSLLSPLMNTQQLCAELGISHAGLNTIRKKHPGMPKPIKLGQRLLWRREEIEMWLRNFLPADKRRTKARGE